MNTISILILTSALCARITWKNRSRRHIDVLKPKYTEIMTTDSSIYRLSKHICMICMHLSMQCVVISL